MDKLTLAELSAYLPWGISVLRPDGKTILPVEGIIGNTCRMGMGKVERG